MTFWKGKLFNLKLDSVVGVSHIIQAVNYLNTGTADFPLKHTLFAVDGSCVVQEMEERNPVGSVLLVFSGGAYRAESVPLKAAIRIDDGRLHEQQNYPDDTLKKSTVYCVTKRFLEVLWSAWGTHVNVRVPVARCFAFIGPHMPLTKTQAVGNFMRDASAGRDVVIN